MRVGEVYIFSGKITRWGYDRYGSPKLAIYVPKNVAEQVKHLVDRKILVIIIASSPQ